ncbi:MAG: hypothetical protein OEZ14_12460 [Acidimicrobiia bacterium]|nr:hypothetical protein [Acidimicrobiia bacterium]
MPKLVKTKDGYAVWGGDYWFAEEVSTERVEELGFASGFDWLGHKTITNAQYRVLVGRELF